jgi:phenylalanyl-tRNA synthetase alpha chain
MDEREAERTSDAELRVNEKKVLLALDSEEGRAWDPRALAEKTGVNEDAVMQAAFMLEEKGLCEIRGIRTLFQHLTEEGKEYAEKGLPERRGLDLLPLPFQAFKDSFTDEKEASISTNWLLQKGWARFEDKDGEKVLVPTGNTFWEYNADEEFLRILHDVEELEGSLLLNRVKENITGVSDKSLNRILGELIRKRNLLASTVQVERTITITEAGHEVVSCGISIKEKITQLTPELLRSGDWITYDFEQYNINLPTKEEFPAKIHPYQRILDMMRRIFTEMGFAEIKGDLIQSAFWNFDALFVPQDHPAREMQDTFYLGVRKPLEVSEEIIRNVKEMHEHGGELNSTGWGGTWRRELSEELLLRTHTTAITLWYLASHPEPPVKVFSIDRVYRRETIDPTHLPEFDQLEGIVMDKGVSFSNLLGLLATFYRKMGFPRIRFRPGYFPYTEPSVEVEVYMPEHGWLELGGAGVFREEVTNPIGVKYPVLAWGLGIGRLAMLSLGLTDIRDLYRSDIDWLRKTRILR